MKALATMLAILATILGGCSVFYAFTGDTPRDGALWMLGAVVTGLLCMLCEQAGSERTYRVHRTYRQR